MTQLRTALLLVLVSVPALLLAADDEDPLAWLEDVNGERAPAWVSPDLRPHARHPRLEGQDPEPDIAGDGRLQLLEGRAERARPLAAQQPGLVPHGHPVLGDGSRCGCSRGRGEDG